MRDVMRKLAGGTKLTEAEASCAMGIVMRGEATQAQIAGFAMGLSARGETVDELVGLARTVREYAVEVHAGTDVLDICGTGGDGLNTFNISTAAAIVTAACGVRVAKHGNRGVSSGCGSADILEELGVVVGLPPDAARRCVQEVGIGFLFAPLYHPAFRHAAQARREMGARTVFNLLGPLTNPARPSRQIMGVPQADLVAPMAEAAGRLGLVHAMVFHSMDGMDELSTSAPADVVEVHQGRRTHYRLDPAELGLPHCDRSELTGGDRMVNAGIVTRLLDGERGPARDVVLLNTAAALKAAGHVTSWRSGLETAALAVDSGNAARLLARWRDLTHRLAAESARATA
ncbi:anthranilate phosphoribosyltransferase [Streptomyces otsuchiensis]|uniref:anthranilate phosphoribosyltransferase n=1 Tax=Streptomyces otsuchiensis TaxID=2681388 RepID=UPI001030175C|nr:anthranilate phosphoribosyltransferase [Streptomyces otsuchiensis]